MITFLICTERSGSNFLTNLVGGLPGVSAPPPSHLFRLFANNHANYGDLAKDSNWRVLIADVVDNFNAKLGIWRTGVTESELAAAVDRRHAFELIAALYAKEAAADGAGKIFVKENQTYFFAAELAAYFGDCRFVHMVRDPRDVASSWVRTDSIPGGVEEAVRTWLTDQTATTQVNADNRMLRLRYEDLVATPTEALQRIAQFLGVEYDDAVLEFYKHPRTVANAKRIQAWQNTQRPIMRANVGRYHENLSSIDVSYIEACCGALMHEFGYATTTDPSSDVETMRGQLTPGRYAIDQQHEVEIRQRRLAAIRRVLNRRLA